jgi:hypothetical protein
VLSAALSFAAIAKELQHEVLASATVVFCTLSVCGREWLAGRLFAGGARSTHSMHTHTHTFTRIYTHTYTHRHTHTHTHTPTPSDTVIIDEAAQALEPDCLIALRAACPLKAWLVGDRQQLPATVLSQRAQRLGLARSMMERLSTERCEHVSVVFSVVVILV